MVQLLASPVTWVAAVLFGAFWLAAYLLPNDALAEILRILQVSVAVVVLTAYAPYAWAGLRSRRPDRVQQLSMGIALGFFSVAAAGLWSLLWRLGGRPTWMVNADVALFCIWLSILAGTLHITAPGAVNGIVPKRNWIMLGLAFGLSVLAALLITVAQPNVSAFLDAIQPWFTESPGLLGRR